eukprot:14544548-Heterocapsa_arctica.AAC.1
MRERIRERTMEGNIRRKDLGAQEICTMTHEGSKAWDDVKQVWQNPSKAREARKEEMEFVTKMK